MFKESCTNINDLTNGISCSACYCVDNEIPDKIVHVYPSNKPWVRKPLKLLLNRERQAFREGNFLELNRLKKEIRKESKAGLQRKNRERLWWKKSTLSLGWYENCYRHQKRKEG